MERSVQIDQKWIDVALNKHREEIKMGRKKLGFWKRLLKKIRGK